MKSVWRDETGIFFGLWLWLAWLGRDQFLLDPGVMWNTVVGQHILAGGGIPRTDEFSCTFAGRPWHCLMWLADCVMAALHSIGGLDSLALGCAVLMAGLYAWVASRMIRAGWHWSAALVLAVLALLTSRYHMLARPHLATIVCLGITVARLIDFEAGRISRTGLLWLVPLFILWTNLHTAVLGGLGTLGLIAFGWSFAWLLGIPSPVRRWPDILFLIGLCLLCGLAMLVNPYSWQLIATMIALLRSQIVQQYMLEHAHLDWHNPYHLIVPFFAFVYLLLLVNVRSRKSFRVTWLLPVVWFLLSVDRIRHCTLFAITTALVIVEMLPQTRLAAWLVEQHSPYYRPVEEGSSANPWRWPQLGMPVLGVIAALGLQWAAVPVPLIGSGWARLSPSFWPTALREKLQDLEHQHPGAAVFDDMAYGGFLIYYTPNLRPFIDDRCEVYGDEFLADYFHTNDALLKAKEAKLGPAEVAPLGFIDRWEKEFGITLDLALVMKESGFHYYFETMRDDWTKLDETSAKFGAALYQRRPVRDASKKRR